MMIARRHRVRMVPVVTVGLAIFIMFSMWHAIAINGKPAGPVLLWSSVPVVVLLTYAAIALCRVERRGDQIHWGRLRLRHSCQANRCMLKGSSQKGGRAWHLTVELVANDRPVLDVATFTEDGNADTKAQRIADALELRFERVSQPPLDARGG